MKRSRLSPARPVFHVRVVVLNEAVLAGAPGLSGLAYPEPAPQAGQIDSLSPSCASVGAQVTITGQGFGAKNVAIAVDGVPAQVVTANGHSATFIVPAGAPLGAKTVTRPNPGGHRGTAQF